MIQLAKKQGPTIGFCLLLLATPVRAENGAAKALTAKESAEGWLLLFDGTTDFGWKCDGIIKTGDGMLQIKGDGMKNTLARHKGRFLDFDLQFDYAQAGKPRKATLTLLNFASNLPDIGPAESIWTTADVLVEEGAAGISYSTVGTHVRPRGFGRTVTGTHLGWNVGSDSVLYLKNVKIRPRGLKPLFNGKDLTGWKEFPGKKSKFTVTPQGEISLKNGPGDLQTEGKYGDFILQLECISNGKHLNSGVFFRCRPNEYQNGYEAQIRNEFTKEPAQEYTLEEYDPATHKLLAKKKAKFTAVDYGTGAIYRRQPARKEVARDGEWFTMTILAYKNHFMTWVNGIPVTDWTDNRPGSDNARTGCRLEAGHISLQGHDPTTDLSFRNLRIAEIK